MNIKIDKLDRKFSEYIRRRAILRVGGCERCLKQFGDLVKENGDLFPAWKHLECSHFFGRSKQSVRCDEDNAVGLCFTCHRVFTENPYDHTVWFTNHLGQEKLETLRLRMLDKTKVDKEELYTYYKDKVRELEV